VNATAAVLVEPRRYDLREFPLPKLSADDGLIRVEACGMCGSDYWQYTGVEDQNGGRPLIPGHEVYGVVESLGSDAASRWGLKVGQRIALEARIPCGACEGCLSSEYTYCGKMTYGLSVGIDVPPSLWGGYATHMYLHPKSLIHRVPDEIPTDVLTLLNPLSGAMEWTLRAGGVGLGNRVVICGAGQRGLMAVLVAKEAGAEHIIVTGTKRSAHRLEMARRLGATATINVDEVDPVEAVREATGGKLADVVIEMTSISTKPVLEALQMVRRGGRIVLIGIKGTNLVDGLATDTIVRKELTIVGVISKTYGSSARALQFMRRHRDLLATLNSKAFALDDVTTAVKTLGREIEGPDYVYQHLRIA
jgi:alcohol dehydrogenase